MQKVEAISKKIFAVHRQFQYISCTEYDESKESKLHIWQWVSKAEWNDRILGTHYIRLAQQLLFLKMRVLRRLHATR